MTAPAATSICLGLAASIASFNLSDCVHVTNTRTFTTLEQDVEIAVGKHGLDVASVDCPSLESVNGASLECTVHVDDATSFKVDVHPVEGELTFQLSARDGAVSARVIAARIARMLHEDMKEAAPELAGVAPTVDCGDNFVLERKGDTLRCSAEFQGKEESLLVTLQEPGYFTFRPA